MLNRKAFKAAVAWTPGRPPVVDPVLFFENGRIVVFGSWPDVQARLPSGIEIEDLGKSLVFPGFINAHCHLDYTDFAGQLQQPKRFLDWIQAILAFKAGFSYTDYAASWLKGARMLLSHGISTVVDIEAVPELVPDVLPGTPLRVISCLEVTGVRAQIPPGQLLNQASAQLAVYESNAEMPARHQFGISPHAPYSTLPEFLSLAAEMSRQQKRVLTIHVSESRDEFELFMTKSGPFEPWLRKQRSLEDCGHGSPVQHLARCGVLGANLLAVHVNYLAPGDARILAASGSSVVHCPRSHDYFGHARFPRVQFEEAGVPVCLGTDSLASTICSRGGAPQLDLFEEMRVYRRAHPSLTPVQALEAVTRQPAAAVGMSGQLGALGEGMLADCAVIPFDGDPSQAAEALVEHRGPVSRTMIAGEWVWIKPGC